jgi:hypothetical protein
MVKKLVDKQRKAFINTFGGKAFGSLSEKQMI